MLGRSILIAAMLVDVHAGEAQRARPRDEPAPEHRASCRLLCAPTIALLPSVLHTHLFGGPLVRPLPNGVVRRLPASSHLELIGVVSARTPLPHVSVYGSVQWLPNATEAENPFTLYTASELGSPIRANAPTASMGVSLSILAAAATGGWVDLGGNVADLFSEAARPDDRSAYTHKLDLELVTHVHAFDWTPPLTYVHRVTVFAILDYVASGLPRAGDEVPVGRAFVTAARPSALIAGLSLPLSDAP